MDLVQRELTKLATAAVIVDEMSKAAQVQDGMAKQAKMKPGLIALLAALGLTGAAGGAYAAGAFGGGGPVRHAIARAKRPTPVESAESLRAKAEAEKASNPAPQWLLQPPVRPNRGIAEMQRRERIRAQADAIRARREADAREFLTDNINRLLGR